MSTVSTGPRACGSALNFLSNFRTTATRPATSASPLEPQLQPQQPPPVSHTSRTHHNALSSLQGPALLSSHGVRDAHPNDQVRKAREFCSDNPSSTHIPQPTNKSPQIQNHSTHTSNIPHIHCQALLPTLLYDSPLNANPPPTKPNSVPLPPDSLDIGTVHPVNLIAAAPSEPLVLGYRLAGREA